MINIADLIMKKGTVYRQLFQSRKKAFAVLIDPDKCSEEHLIAIASSKHIDLFLVGSSILLKSSINSAIHTIKKHSKKPVLIFPGNIIQLSNDADGILLLSLISGRNPELLIGNHVIASPFIKEAGIETISTGYILIESGNYTSVEYMSNTKPIPRNKEDIAVATALAGEQLGMKAVYLDAGSGAKETVPLTMIQKVKKNINIPLIVGGGIHNENQAASACKAGADIIVVGNAIEKDLTLIKKIATTIHSFA